MAVSATLRISDPAALPRAASALSRHADQLDGVRRGAETAGGRIETQVAGDVAALRARLSRAEQRLGAVDPRDEAAVRQAQHDVDRARGALGEAQAAQRKVTEALTGLRRELQRVSASRALAEQGARALRLFWERLGRTRSAFAAAVAQHRGPGDVADPRRLLGGGGSGGPRSSVAEHTEGPVGRLVDDLLDHVVEDVRDRMVDEVSDQLTEALGSERPGVRPSPEFPVLGDGRRVLVPLDRLVDLDPISGPEAFEKLPLQEMFRGLRLLEEQVLPAVRRGLGREQIREMDERAGTAGSPHGLLAVYDAFFGGEEHAVVVTRRTDGSYSVEAGRHRFWAARRLLLEALPVVVR